VSEKIKVKISTFRIQQFTMPDAPLLEDFASISPYSLRFMLEPPDVNIADVPFNASFASGKGMKAVHVAKGTIYMFPDFPGGQVTESIPIAIKGKRQSNPKDMDGVVLHTASVFSPEKSVPEKNFNFTAPHLNELGWDVVVPGNAKAGEMYLGTIPPDPVSVITDGYGVNAVVDPGENIALLSHAIELPPGPASISLWFAVEKFDRNNNDIPTITIALLENSSNLSYTTIRGAEILGDSRYQFLRTTYDVIGPKVQALVQVAGTQKSGRAEIYIDNVRVYPSAREVDRALGATRLPIDFDGTFEFVLKGLGFLVQENEAVSYGSSVFLQKGINRTLHPTGFNQSMILSLDQPESAIQVSIGPNAVSGSLYPRELTARAHVQKVREGGGFFALGLTNGLLESVTFISNDRLPLDPTWHSLSTSGMITRPGLFEPMIIIQNQNIPGAFPGVILDGATLAVDDITLEAFQDSAYFWDHKVLPAN